MDTTRGLVALLIGLLIASNTAAADEFHYRSVLIGDRALGMGGAFTAIADDPSAAYYNPAGLSLVSNSSVSASLQVNSIDRRTVNDAYTGVGGQRADFRHSADPSIPIFVSLLKKVGPKDEDGEQRHAVGISTFHPDGRALDYRVALDAADVTDPTIRIFEDYRVRHEDSTSWFGPSYAYAVSDSFALGLSAFLSTRTLRHQEDLSQVDANATGANSADTQRFLVQNASIDLTARHVVLRLGVMYAPTSHLQLGLMFQPPGIRLSSSATIDARNLSAFPGELPQFARTRQEVSAASPVPWELRAGVGYFANASDLKLALDLSLHGPSGSPSDPVRAIGSPRQEPNFVGYVPWIGDFLVEQYSRVLTVNAALGMEMTIADTVPLRVGAFTNRSAARDLPTTAQQYRADDVHQYGASLSFGLRAGGYDLSIGGAAMFGVGEGLRKLGPAEAAADPNNASYGRTNITDSTIVFFITGYRQALSRAARVAYEEI